MSEFIGPALPPHLAALKNESTEDDSSYNSECKEKSSSESKPAIGPCLPPSCPTSEADDKEDDSLFGPSLPPHLKNNAMKVMGPSLPSGFQRVEVEDSDSEEETIGPLPPPVTQSLAGEKEIIAKEFEARSKKMKDKLTGNDKPEKLEREEWMTELPPVLQGFGMGPRSFKMNPTKIGDRSVWTDTPQDKAKRALKQQSGSKTTADPISKYVRERDAEIAKQISTYEPEKGQESLMSIHEKSRKRKLKEEGSASDNIRRPFDRDVDLQANRFDDAAKKRVMKQSQGLNSRFSHGETSGTFL